jgi:hypothetical protein
MVPLTDPAFDLQLVHRGIPPKALKRRIEKVSQHRPSKGPLFLGEVKPGKGGYEIFARFVAIVLVGALPAFCISLAKTTVRAVGKNADGVVLSKAGRELGEAVLKAGQKLELRLSRNPEDNDLPGLVGRAVIRTVGRVSRKENCEDDRQGEASSEQCDRRDQLTKVRDVIGKAHRSTQEARHRR